MKLKRYVNGAWVVVDKELKQLTTATDSAASPITIIVPLAEPFGNYRVYGTSEGAGVQTENLWDARSTSLTEMQVAGSGSRRLAFTISEPGIYTVKCFNDRSGYVYCRRYNVTTGNYSPYYPLSVPKESTDTPQTKTLEVDSDAILIIYLRDTGTVDETIAHFNLSRLCAVSGSTAPDHYIPPGYQIPLTNTSGQQSETYPLYIGDTKLYEGEYLDYREQKIYKDVSGTLAPTDPPVPFPSVQHYEGESTTSVDTTVAPDKLELTYQGWRVAANPEPKIYQNGQWMTEYRRVEYIKSDGNPYIVTDIVGLNAATDYIEAEMSFGALSQLNAGTCLFGCATFDSDHWTAFCVFGYAYDASANVRNNRFMFFPNYATGGETAKRMSCATNNDYSSKLLLSLKTPQATIVNTSTSTTYTPTIFDPIYDATTLQPIDFTQLAKFCVFAAQYYRGENDVLYNRCGRETSCYDLNIYRNDTLIHNLIPVERQIDGVLGLYDTITDTFYTNAGTGTFVKGGYI